jgi:hypothetical protein
MRIARLHIENFRSIRTLDIELSDTTVFIGPNNAGKTAILDALRIALTRRWGQRGTGFTEYDIHLANDGDDPKASPGVSIELRVEEKFPGEWSDNVQQALDELIQPDPHTGLSSITLRAACSWSATTNAFEPSWVFLNAARLPLIGGGTRRLNLERFWEFLPAFYLGALRDASDEFSSRSQFWGRLLKAMVIPSELEGRIQRVLREIGMVRWTFASYRSSLGTSFPTRRLSCATSLIGRGYRFKSTGREFKAFRSSSCSMRSSTISSLNCTNRRAYLSWHSKSRRHTFTLKLRVHCGTTFSSCRARRSSQRTLLSSFRACRFETFASFG